MTSIRNIPDWCWLHKRPLIRIELPIMDWESLLSPKVPIADVLWNQPNITSLIIYQAKNNIGLDNGLVRSIFIIYLLEIPSSQKDTPSNKPSSTHNMTPHVTLHMTQRGCLTRPSLFRADCSHEALSNLTYISSGLWPYLVVFKGRFALNHGQPVPWPADLTGIWIILK